MNVEMLEMLVVGLLVIAAIGIFVKGSIELIRYDTEILESKIEKLEKMNTEQYNILNAKINTIAKELCVDTTACNTINERMEIKIIGKP